jgi:hypothetical protein
MAKCAGYVEATGATALLRWLHRLDGALVESLYRRTAAMDVQRVAVTMAALRRAAAALMRGATTVTNGGCTDLALMGASALRWQLVSARAIVAAAEAADSAAAAAAAERAVGDACTVVQRLCTHLFRNSSRADGEGASEALPAVLEVLSEHLQQLPLRLRAAASSQTSASTGARSNADAATPPATAMMPRAMQLKLQAATAGAATTAVTPVARRQVSASDRLVAFSVATLMQQAVGAVDRERARAVAALVAAAAAARRGEPMDVDNDDNNDAGHALALTNEAIGVDGEVADERSTAPAAEDDAAVATCAETAAACALALEDGVERALTALDGGGGGGHWSEAACRHALFHTLASTLKIHAHCVAAGTAVVSSADEQVPCSLRGMGRRLAEAGRRLTASSCAGEVEVEGDELVGVGGNSESPQQQSSYEVVFGRASLVQYVAAASAAMGFISPLPPPAVQEHVLALLLHLLRGAPRDAAAAAAALHAVLRAGGRRQLMAACRATERALWADTGAAAAVVVAQRRYGLGVAGLATLEVLLDVKVSAREMSMG